MPRVSRLDIIKHSVRLALKNAALTGYISFGTYTPEADACISGFVCCARRSICKVFLERDSYVEIYESASPRYREMVRQSLSCDSISTPLAIFSQVRELRSPQPGCSITHVGR